MPAYALSEFRERPRDPTLKSKKIFLTTKVISLHEGILDAQAPNLLFLVGARRDHLKMRGRKADASGGVRKAFPKVRALVALGH